jgi:transposase
VDEQQGPRLFKKEKEVLDLYHDPPTDSLVFCVDEKTSLQAREPVNVKPMMPGTPMRRDPEYRRHGAIHMLASLDVHTGQVQAMFMSNCTNVEFKDFLGQVYWEAPRDKDIHIIVDNLAVHKHPVVKEWLTNHPRVHMHFTPTHASWLNQIELWFSILQRQKLKRAIFKSIEDLIDQAFQYIKEYNRSARPFAWTYRGKPLKI